MVYDLFNMMLDSVSKYFIEDYCFCIHKGYWSMAFFNTPFPGFGSRIMLALQNEFVSIFPFVFYGKV
jgi:hypothetical protein